MDYLLLLEAFGFLFGYATLLILLILIIKRQKQLAEILALAFEKPVICKKCGKPEDEHTIKEAKICGIWEKPEKKEDLKRKIFG